jgi:hypothetical protein
VQQVPANRIATLARYGMAGQPLLAEREQLPRGHHDVREPFVGAGIAEDQVNDPLRHRQCPLPSRLYQILMAHTRHRGQRSLASDGVGALRTALLYP